MMYNKPNNLMNTRQAYINGFVKRAMEHGFSEAEAMDILKQAVDNDSIHQAGQRSYLAAPAAEHPVVPAPPTGVPAWTDPKARKPAAAAKPAINPAHLNDLGRFTPAR